MGPDLRVPRRNYLGQIIPGRPSHEVGGFIDYPAQNTIRSWECLQPPLERQQGGGGRTPFPCLVLEMTSPRPPPPAGAEKRKSSRSGCGGVVVARESFQSRIPRTAARTFSRRCWPNKAVGGRFPRSCCCSGWLRARSISGRRRLGFRSVAETREFGSLGRGRRGQGRGRGLRWEGRSLSNWSFQCGLLSSGCLISPPLPLSCLSFPFPGNVFLFPLLPRCDLFLSCSLPVSLFAASLCCLRSDVSSSAGMSCIAKAKLNCQLICIAKGRALMVGQELFWREGGQ